MSSLIFQIDTDLKNRFKSECAKKGLSMREVLLQWIAQFTQETKDSPTKVKEDENPRNTQTA